MAEITLYNNGSTQMSVMALGKAINWNPQTTLNVSEKEAEILLKYSHIQKLEDVRSNAPSEALSIENKELKEEIAKLKEELSKLAPKEINREALKKEATDLGIDFPANIGNEKLIKLINEAK